MRKVLTAAAVMFAAGILTAAACGASEDSGYTFTVREEHLMAQDCEGTLVDVTMEAPGEEALAEAVTQGLRQTVYAGQYGIWERIQEMAEESRQETGSVRYGPYGVTGSWLGGNVTQGLICGRTYDNSYAGGPHPWGHYTSGCFDRRTGRIVTLADILTDNVDWNLFTQLYLTALKNDVDRQALALFSDQGEEQALLELAQLEVGLIRDNAAGGDNPGAWIMTSEGLNFAYPAGSLTIYAAGDAELTIPAQALSQIVKPEYIPAASGLSDSGNASAPYDPNGMNTSQTLQPELAPSGQTAHQYAVIITDMTWEEARRDAEAKGGRLAVITSVQEQQQIEAVLSAFPDIHTVWLGAVKQGSSQFAWVDSSALSYTQWGPGEPNNDTGDEYYLDMYEKDGRWYWNDVPNDISRYYSGKMGYVLQIG